MSKWTMSGFTCAVALGDPKLQELFEGAGCHHRARSHPDQGRVLRLGAKAISETDQSGTDSDSHEV